MSTVADRPARYSFWVSEPGFGIANTLGPHYLNLGVSLREISSALSALTPSASIAIYL